MLARHAVGALDAVDELHVARWGVAGSESAAEARRAQREEAREWRDGELVHEKHRHAELIWYPDPVGARECELVATGVELLVAANPGAGRITARLGVPPTKRFTPPGRRDPGLGWGAVRVEAWGWRGTARTSVVYGVIERTAVAAGTVLGVTGACLAGALPALSTLPAGGRVRPRVGGRAGAVPRRAGPAGREGGGVRGRRRRLTRPDSQPVRDREPAIAAPLASLLDRGDGRGQRRSQAEPGQATPSELPNPAGQAGATSAAARSPRGRWADHALPRLEDDRVAKDRQCRRSPARPCSPRSDAAAAGTTPASAPAPRDTHGRAAAAEGDASSAVDASGLRTVTYQGVQFDVPGRLAGVRPRRRPVRRACASTCTRSTSVTRAPTWTARPAIVGRADAVLVEPTDGERTAAAGRGDSSADVAASTAERSRGAGGQPTARQRARSRPTLPSAGVSVTLTYQDSDATAQQILQSFRAAS